MVWRQARSGLGDESAETVYCVGKDDAVGGQRCQPGLADITYNP